MIDFKQAFWDDCITKGYSEAEAELFYNKFGEDFINDRLSELWDEWSEKFPVEDKEEE